MTEQHQLQNNFNSLSQKKLELEKKVNDLTTEKSQLQRDFDSLRQKKLELESKVTSLSEELKKKESKRGQYTYVFMSLFLLYLSCTQFYRAVQRPLEGQVLKV